jgi:peptidoglycan-N-acetylglucosamine deacetylase
MSKYYIASTAFLVLMISSLIVDGRIDIPLLWYVGLCLLYFMTCALGAMNLSWQFFTSVVSSGKASGVSLSFDDGPVRGKTDVVLDILRNHNVPAAFFCIGERMSMNPELVRRIHDEGHIIGNHSFYHRVTFDLQSSSMISKELYDTDVVLHRLTGKRPKFFRPPYGVTNPMVARAVKRRNYKVIGWSIRSFDTITSDPRKLFKRVTRTLKNGDIILLHDHCESTIEILPLLLDHISKSGFKVVRIDELINEKAYV